jgi:hypothetical protein
MHPDVTFTHTEPVRDGRLFKGNDLTVASLRRSSKSTIFLGEARIGKTSMLLHLKRELASLDSSTRLRVPIYLNLRNPTYNTPTDVFQYILGYLHREIERLSISLDLEPPKGVHDSESVLSYLRYLDFRGLQLQILLLVDNLDQPEKFLNDRFRLYQDLRQIQIFSSDAGSDVQIMATASPAFLSFEGSVTSKLIERLNQVFLRPLSYKESISLLSLSSDLNAEKTSMALKDFIYDETGGHPCLIQEIMANSLQDFRIDAGSLPEIVKLECKKIEERGASFFQSYIRSLDHEHFLYLHSIATQTLNGDQRPTVAAAQRFGASGLVTNSDNGESEPTCKLFFRWFRRNLSTLFPAIAQSVSPLRTIDSLLTFLSTSLRQVLGRRKAISERTIQDVLGGLFCGAGISIQAEVSTAYRGKSYRADFLVSDLSLPIEIKIIKTADSVGPVLDQVQADLPAYLDAWGRAAFLIYDMSDSAVRLRTFVDREPNPLVAYIIVDHFLY